MILIIGLLFYFGLSQWKLIDTIIINESNSTLNDWYQSNSSVESCTTSNERNVILSQNGSIVKYYQHKVQAIQLVLDVYYDFYNIGTNLQSEMNIALNGMYGKNLQSKIINPTDLQLQRKICLDANPYPFQQETIITDIIETNQYPFYLNLSFTNNNSDYSNKLRIRNLYVYGFICNSFCQSCTVGIPSQCLTCYNLTDTPCTCNYPTKFVIKQIGCVQECPRDNYLTSAYHECYFDQRIQSLYYYLNTSQELGQLLTPNIALNNDYSGISAIFTTQKIEIPLGTLQPNMTLIRIRMTIYFKQFDVHSCFKIGLDGVNQSYIYYNGTYFFLLYQPNLDSYVRNQWLYADMSNVNLPVVNSLVYRLEFLLNNTNINPILFFEDNQIEWAFFNLTIDIGVCQLNCQTCKTAVTCDVCLIGYKLYDSKCVQTCPSYTQSNSTHCVDYKNIISYSNYLVKAFYDNLMTLYEIFSHIDLVTNQDQSIFIGSNFSYLQNKTVLGGMLVWNNQIYQKTYNIPYNPHYNVSIRFNITFGDKFQGTFKYCFESTLCKVITRIISASDQNIIGTQTPETIQYVFENIQHQNTQLQIMFECQSSNPIIEGFCAISEYFIIIHQCYDFYYCLTCNQMYNCTSCIFQDDNKRFLMKGKCICNQYFNRVFTNSKCQCQNGYQDIENNFYCEPICGDMLIVKGEDCDDGNLNPYDGCHQCKYQCAIECNLCVKGKCLECQNNFILIQDKCIQKCNQSNTIYPCAINKYLVKNSETTIQQFEIQDNYQQLQPYIHKISDNPCSEHYITDFQQIFSLKYCFYEIHYQFQKEQQLQNETYLQQHQDQQQILYTQQICGNGISEGTEECDDGNVNPFDGCFNCHYSCFNNHQNQVLEQCIPINQQFEITQFNNKFDYITKDSQTCGNYLIEGSEQCDDNNLIPFEGCHQCSLVCSEHCQFCVKGICLICDSDWNLTNNQCIPICGNQKLQGNEQCESQTPQLNVGGCLYCQCIEGYFPMNENCFPICGDGIKTIEEECDDGNLISLDGCSQKCKFECINCIECITGICKSCQSGYYFDQNQNCNKTVCGDSIKVEQEQCDDGNQVQNDGCYDCLCELGYQYTQNRCQFICGDGIQTKEEECDDGNLISLDGCSQKCKIECINCNDCIIGKCQSCQSGYYFDQNQICNKTICGDQIKVEQEQCDDGNQVQNDGCYDCQCELGYQYTQNGCLPICGDGIKKIEEECDDGNLISLDGCSLNCKIECINCIECVTGICQSCQTGYYFDQNQICNKTICGDSIKVGQEQCDDGNLVQNDGCFDCLCELGYQQTQNGCQSICGDGIIVKGEQCDDNNNIQYDGCYYCQYDCNKECQICQQNICLQCNYGYNLLNNDCINICGDGLLNKNKEQCDDNNNIPRDGCYNCQIEQGYICYDDNLKFVNCQRCQDTNCNQCILDNQIEKCSQCQKGYYLNDKQDCIKCANICIDCADQSKNCINYNYQVYQVKDCDNKKGFYYNYNKRDCETKCGDGIIVGNEQCDDKNFDDFDGCNSKCQIEKGFLFDIESQQLIKFPKIDAILDENENEVQSNSYHYSLKSEVETQIINCSETMLKIDNFTSDDFNFTTNSNNTNCQIQLQYFKTISTQNIIHIYINHLSKYKTRLLSEQDLFLMEIKIEPKKQVYISENQKVQAKSIAQTQQAMSQSLMVLAPMAIMMGGFQFIWAILDILSWLNNFYYLNVKYPTNVEQVFLQAEWSNLMQFPSIDYFNNKDSNYYFEAPKKFYDKGVDPLFFNNIQSVLFFLGQVLLTKIFCKGFIKIINYFCRKTTINHRNVKIFKLHTINKRTNTEQQIDSTQAIEIVVPSILQSTFKKCLEFEEYFIANLLKVLQINFLDLTLAVMLQLTNQQKQNYILVRINIICSYITLLLLVIILYFSYIISTQHKLLLENKKFKTHYGCFYEDVNTDSNIAMLYSLVNLLRKTVFIISTVYFYDKPIYQTSFCFLSSLLNLLILVNQNPFESKQQYILNIIPDISVMIVTAVAIILAFQDTFNILSDVLVEVLGWLIVCCIYSAIGIQLIFLIKQLLMEMYEKMKKIKQYILNKGQ